MRQAGRRVSLCHPGVDTHEFYPADADEKKALREKAGFGADDYIVGVVCMNQGRKAISQMIAAFHEFARDKTRARLILDMEKASPAGWDIPRLLEQMGWTEEERARVKYQVDLFSASPDMLPLRNRYALMDAHMVIAHREGFGLPLLESMACKIPTLALDWCSGPEIVGNGRGYLVKRIDYMEHGCWGGARDAFPDMRDLVNGLRVFYELPGQAAATAEQGYAWAIKQTWDTTADQVEAVIQEALQRQRSLEPDGRTTGDPSAAPGLSDVYGPALEPVRDRPVLQSLAGSDPMLKEPVSIGMAGGPGRADGDTRAG